jgi:RNA polymerase sigma-70 factor, ECF subfamily
VDARAEFMDRIDTEPAPFHFEQCFQANYARIARAAARIVGDPARAEEVAVEAFWKLWRTPQAQGEHAMGWVYRTAIRLALNDLRGQQRRTHYESQSAAPAAVPTPEEAHAVEQTRERVRRVLAELEPRDAELLLLRHQGLSYEELAAAIDVKASSIGTLLARAQKAFRKEYIRIYGEE